MTERDLQPLSTEAQALLASELSREEADPALRAEVLGAVLTTVGATALASPVPPAPKALAGKIGALALAASLGSGLTYWALHLPSPPPPVQMEVPLPAPSVPTQPPPPAPAPALPLPPTPEPAPPSSRSEKPSAASTLAVEQRLLRQARTALLAGNPQAALKVLEEHRRRILAPRMEEEREALWVQSLVAVGRVDQARERLARFVRKFPQSPSRTALEEQVARSIAPQR